MLAFADVTLTFAKWILAQKRHLYPDRLYVVGVNGSLGQGKSYFCRALASSLNALLRPEEGQAVTRSLDDYYLTHAQRTRPEFLARGYHPKGISNRGPAGTHDLRRLAQDLSGLEQGGDSRVLDLPSFDKRTDDRSPRSFIVKGKVAVFLFEGWFVGAKTDVDVKKTPPGLKRSVARALQSYKPLFERLDALWVFEPPVSLRDVIAQRLEQEETLRRQTRRPGMTPEQIRRFVDYFYKDSWQDGVTSPFPPRTAATFWATTDLQHRFLKIQT